MNTDSVNTSTNSTDEELVKVGVRLPELLWRTVKAAAALSGETAEGRVARILEEYEAKESQKRLKR